MTYFRIYDFRISSDSTAARTNLYVDGLGGGERPSNIEPARAGAMLAIFNSGRDCYWNSDGSVFVTNAGVEPDPKASKADSGRVMSWDIRLPATGPIQILLALKAGEDARQTSGNDAAAWAIVEIEEKALAIVLPILSSKFCKYADGILTNSEILENPRR